MIWLHIGWTIILLTTFVVIVAWAWNKNRKDDFSRASQIPLEEDRATVRNQRD